MSKKFVVGLIVAFVMAALPMVAQAQPNLSGPPPVSNCKYIGPVEPLALQTVSWSDTRSGWVKTVKAQKEIFYCYSDARSVPDDKVLQDPMANRDAITKNLRYIVEMEIFAFIEEQFPGAPAVPPTIWKEFQVTRCIKERKTSGTTGPIGIGLPGTLLDTWVVIGCEYWAQNPLANYFPSTWNELFFGYHIYNGPVQPVIPTAARRCGDDGRGKAFGRAPYTGGPIPIEDPIEMNTVLVDVNNDGVPEYAKTMKVNKEVFRCFTSGQPDAPAIWDIELYTEEIEDLVTLTGNAPYLPGPGNIGLAHQAYFKNFEVAYCAKKEKEAVFLGCTWRSVGDVPFVASGLPAALKPFTTLTSAGVRSSAGKYVFEAQGYNIEGVQVQVYNLSGKQVFSAETGGTQLSWNGLSSDGRPLPNGVYLYVMTVKGTYGDIVQTKVQKIAILR